MSHKKFLAALLLAFVISTQLFSQSFTYSGDTNPVIPYGSGSINGHYHFTYANVTGLITPTLVVALDNKVISYDLTNVPNGGYRPASYDITFTEGIHTVKFSLLSVGTSKYDPIRTA
jgi:hypothetical protein